jgi:hypothetical protein
MRSRVMLCLLAWVWLRWLCFLTLRPDKTQKTVLSTFDLEPCALLMSPPCTSRRVINTQLRLLQPVRWLLGVEIRQGMRRAWYGLGVELVTGGLKLRWPHVWLGKWTIRHIAPFSTGPGKKYAIEQFWGSLWLCVSGIWSVASLFSAFNQLKF